MQKAKCIAFVHHKGGTGKTTSCINIAGYLTKMDKKTLVIDLDPQANATTGLGIDRKTIDYSIYDVLFGSKNIGNIILETASGIYLAPSSSDLLAAETHLAGTKAHTRILKENLVSIKEYFDYILIDVPPGSTLLMINGVVAADSLIVPLDSGVFAFETIETLVTLLEDIREEIGVEVDIISILLKKYPAPVSIFTKNPTGEIRNMLNKYFIENDIICPDILEVPYSQEVYQAQKKGLPISHYAPYCGAARAYRKAAEVIVQNMEP